MNKLMTAVALSIALPAAALAQAAAPANPHAGHNMAASGGQDHAKCMTMDHQKMSMSGMDHSKMAGMDHSKIDHSKMDMSGMDMAGMEHCTAKPASDAGKAQPSSTQKR